MVQTIEKQKCTLEDFFAEDDDIPDFYMCNTFTDVIFKVPAMLNGRIYEKSEILHWIRKEGTDPFTRMEADEEYVQTVMKSAIGLDQFMLKKVNQFCAKLKKYLTTHATERAPTSDNKTTVRSFISTVALFLCCIVKPSITQENDPNNNNKSKSNSSENQLSSELRKDQEMAVYSEDHYVRARSFCATDDKFLRHFTKQDLLMCVMSHAKNNRMVLDSVVRFLDDFYQHNAGDTSSDHVTLSWNNTTTPTSPNAENNDSNNNNSSNNDNSAEVQVEIATTMTDDFCSFLRHVDHHHQSDNNKSKSKGNNNSVLLSLVSDGLSERDEASEDSGDVKREMFVVPDGFPPNLQSVFLVAQYLMPFLKGNIGGGAIGNQDNFDLPILFAATEVNKRNYKGAAFGLGKWKSASLIVTRKSIMLFHEDLRKELQNILKRTGCTLKDVQQFLNTKQGLLSKPLAELMFEDGIYCRAYSEPKKSQVSRYGPLNSRVILGDSKGKEKWIIETKKETARELSLVVRFLSLVR